MAATAVAADPELAVHRRGVVHQLVLVAGRLVLRRRQAAAAASLAAIPGPARWPGRARLVLLDVDDEAAAPGALGLLPPPVLRGPPGRELVRGRRDGEPGLPAGQLVGGRPLEHPLARKFFWVLAMGQLECRRLVLRWWRPLLRLGLGLGPDEAEAATGR
jgi:hypothetical protein